MPWQHIGAIAASASLALASASAVYSYGRFARKARGRDLTALPVADRATELDRLIAPLLARHARHSGLAMISANLEAFAARLFLARGAGRSLDVMYYYWRNDLTGNLLARELLAAARRGVRVRVLIDDFNIRGSDRALVALQKHPNIDVRLFNPIVNRGSSLRRGLELLLRLFTVNRRMHNKAWIADGRAAVIGGRNIGDAYFDAAQQANFRDLDLLGVGPVVDEAVAIFDRFFNSEASLRIKALASAKSGNLPRLERKLEAAAATGRAREYLAATDRATAGIAAMLTEDRLSWTAEASVISDPPEKALGAAAEHWISDRISALIGQAQQDVAIISPYFIPGPNGVQRLTGLVSQGARARVLTNSLASTDVAAVHGGYAPYRLPLLDGGVELYELRPETGRKRMSLFGSSTASLHTKAFAVDADRGFVGSFNFDPRSKSINTEMGIVFRHPKLVADLREVFADEIGAHSAYRLEVDDGRLSWIDGNRRLNREPASSRARRAVAWAVRWLPVKSLL